ncbi:MAG: hypothetical protein ABJF10_26210 [Chthoniobacter sp.]|uniref:hypothetical protein n=1 Tax=Chthoniobacter sp. TaxID=2510640 RepID=UPI0032A7E7EB
MNFLRSTLLIAIVSLLVLTGYAHAVTDTCCAHEQQQEQTGNGNAASTSDDGCQCLCHQIFSNVSAAPVRLPALGLVLPAVRMPGEFPPDTVPQGIDYPPQLA